VARVSWFEKNPFKLKRGNRYYLFPRDIHLPGPSINVGQGVVGLVWSF